MSTTTTGRSIGTLNSDAPVPRIPKQSSGDKAFATVAHALLIVWTIIVVAGSRGWWSARKMIST